VGCRLKKGKNADKYAHRSGNHSDIKKKDELPVGGSVVGVIVGAGLIVFLVLLFTGIIGEKDVYSFDNN